MADEVLPSTIIYPEAFLRSLPAGFDGVYDWSAWRAAIDTRGIAPMDIDANVELMNFFLQAETKDDGVTVPYGQQMALNAYARTGLVTILTIWGKTIPIRWQYQNWKRQSREFDERKPCSWLDGTTPDAQIFCFIRKWAYHHRALNNDFWRSRMIKAALYQAPPSLRQELVERLKRENRAALGGFVDTPLGNSAVDF